MDSRRLSGSSRFRSFVKRLGLSKLTKPTLFILTVSLLTASALFTQEGAWPPEDNARYACYFLVAIFAASLKVRGGDNTGATSMSFVFVIIALVELNLKETVLIGGPAIIIQAATRKLTQDRASETLGTLLSTLTSALVSQWVYHSGFLKGEIEAPVRLVIAVMVSFAAYNFPVAIAGIMASGFSRKRLLRAMYLWSFHYHVIAGAVTALYSFICPFVNWYAPALLMPMMYMIYWSYALYEKRLERQRSHAVMVSKLHMRTIETLALAIEAKDQTTHRHLQRVQIFATELGKELGMNDTELEALRAGAVMHDIGKLAVPEHILSKPGKLTPEEFDKMKIHPVVGGDIVERVRFPYAVAPIVRAHHERWDGSGYPEGLKGEAIPFGARILAAVDCLDALSSDRQYRRALPLDRAMDEIVSKSGKDFDPRVVAVLRLRYRDLDAMARRAEPMKPLIDPNGLNALEFAAAHANPEDPASQPQPQFLGTIGAARMEVQKLFELAQELGTSLETRKTYAVLSRGLEPLVPYDALAVFIESDGKLVPEYLHGRDAGLLSSLSVAVGAGVSGWVAANSKAAVDFSPDREGPGMSAFGSMLSVPLVGRHGSLGALSLYSRQRASLGADHLRLLNAIVPKLSLAVENGLTFQKAEASATTDYLTGLPNAHSLFVHLEREVEVSRYLSAPLSVLLCDLNGFKNINDTQGHLMGNRLLEGVAKGLQGLCTEYEYVARMGGDEFVIVCSGQPPEAIAVRMLQFREAIREVGNGLCGAGLLDASFGSAAFPVDGETADELLAASDRHMYREKAQQKRTGWRPMDNLKAARNPSQQEPVALV